MDCLGLLPMAHYPYGVASSRSAGVVYFAGGEYNGEMYAVDVATGKTLFDSSLYASGFGCDCWAPTVYQDRRVFFATGAGEGNDGLIGEVGAYDQN